MPQASASLGQPRPASTSLGQPRPASATLGHPWPPLASPGCLADVLWLVGHSGPVSHLGRRARRHRSARLCTRRPRHRVREASGTPTTTASPPRTTSPPHHLTTSPPHHPATPPPHHTTTPPHHRLTALPPHPLHSLPRHRVRATSGGLRAGRSTFHRGSIIWRAAAAARGRRPRHVPRRPIYPSPTLPLPPPLPLPLPQPLPNPTSLTD